MDRVIFKCERCGKEYEISKYAFNNRIKQNNFICKNCHISDSIKDHWKNMSDEKKENRSKKLSLKTKENYNKLSDLEKEEYRQKRIKYHENLSPEEKKSIKQKQLDGWKNMPEEKKKAFIKSHIDYYNNMTEEEHNKFVQIHKDGWSKKSECEIKEFSKLKHDQYENLSDEEKKAWSKKSKENWNNVKDAVRKGYDEWRNNLSEEEKYEISKRSKQFWDKMSEEERADFIKKSHAWYSNLSDEEKKSLISKSHKWYHELSNEELKLYKEKISKSSKAYWENLSNEEKENIRNKIKDHWKNMPDEEKLKRSMKISKTSKYKWELMPQERKDYLIHNSGIGKIVSNLSKKFETLFYNLEISDYYVLIKEYQCRKENIYHKWDFALFDKNYNLLMLIDIDGGYFHADICDYDGIRSKIYYDETRSLTIPKGVLHIIIQESNFDKCFDEFLNILKMNINEYSKYMMKIFRSIPFPFPRYDDINLLRSYERLSTLKFDNDFYKLIYNDTRLGDRLIYHFHQSIWMKKCDGKISPYEAWYDDNILQKLIEDNVIYQTHLNKNKILQGFDICEIAPKINFISAGQWKLILSKYWSSDIFNIMGDPSLLLSAIALKINCYGKYENETIEMINFLNKYGINYTGIDCINNNIVAHVKNDKEMKEIINKYKCKKYLFVLDETEYDCDEFLVRSFNNEKYNIIVKN